jgi:uncharacterized protein (TIRG00374 family)
VTTASERTVEAPAQIPIAVAPDIDEFPRTGYVRSPSDLVRLVGALILLVIVYLVTAVYRDGVASIQAGFLDVVSSFPRGIRAALVGLTQVVAVVAPISLAVVLLVRRRLRLLFGIIAAALVAIALTTFVGSVVLDNAHPVSWQVEQRTQSWLAHTSFPTAAYMAALAAVVTVAGGWVSRRWRRALWIVVLLIALLRVGTSGIVALDLLFAITAGIAAGAAVLLAIGGPDRSPRGVDVADGLAAAGLPVTDLREFPSRRSVSLEYRATTADGPELHVTVHDEEDRRRDVLFRLYQVLRLRGVGAERNVFTSLRQDVEHDVFMSMWAARAGVRVPDVKALRAVGSGSIMEASDWIDGRWLDSLAASDVTDEMLLSFWTSVGVLHDRHIDHRALRADNALTDAHGDIWLTGFQDAEVDGPPAHRAQDVAEALVSMTLLTSSDRAVSTATTALGGDRLAEALPQLQPLALSRDTQHRLRHSRKLLDELRSKVSEATGTKEVELAHLERVRPRTVVTVLAAFVAMWVLLPTLANAGDTVDALREVDPLYVLAMLPLTLLLYVFSTLQLMGACAEHLPFGATYRCQMAAAFMNRVTPNNVGGMGVNARYLQRAGIDAAAAAAAVGVSTVADQILTALLILLFVVWAGRGTNNFSFSFADASTLLVVVAVVFAVLGLVMVSARGRKFLREKVLPFFKGVRHSLVEVAKSPSRLLLIFGGSLGHTATDFTALVVALGAFGPLPSIGSLGAVYFGASAVGSASPTPGGVGAIEAAMIAGLTGIGVDVAVATPAVLIYRLITYWAVMLPGWISLGVMKKHGEV